MSPLFEGLALFGVGCLAGVVNVVAGGGSFLTLPVLIFFGLPPTVANGTNRVAILLQNVGATWSFSRAGLVDRAALRWAAAPATAGAALGTWGAIVIGDIAFQRILALVMVVVFLWVLWGPRPGGEDGSANGEGVAGPPAGRAAVALGCGFFVVGVYGGFIQAGVGFFALTATSAAGLDLVRGNAVKVVTILCFTALSLGLFAWQGKVDWRLGLLLAAGTVVGGLAGARLTVLKGHRWVRAVVTLVAVLFALQLWTTAR